MRWEPVPDKDFNGEILGYVIYYQNDTASSSKGFRITTPSIPFTLNDLSTSTMYTLHVCAYNSVGDGPCAKTDQRTLPSSKFEFYISVI